MKGDLERSAVELVARSAPWLAPVPSAFFVARSGMEHLALPLVVAVTAAAIIETLGLATVHTALWLSEWNQVKRKSDPRAPTWLAVALVGAYLATTLGLVVALLGVSRTTVYSYLDELERQGLVARNNGDVEVKHG